MSESPEGKSLRAKEFRRTGRFLNLIKAEVQTAAIRSKDMKSNKKPFWQNHRIFCNLVVRPLKIKGRTQGHNQKDQGKKIRYNQQRTYKGANKNDFP